MPSHVRGALPPCHGFRRRRRRTVLDLTSQINRLPALSTMYSRSPSVSKHTPHGGTGRGAAGAAPSPSVAGAAYANDRRWITGSSPGSAGRRMLTYSGGWCSVHVTKSRLPRRTTEAGGGACRREAASALTMIPRPWHAYLRRGCMTTWSTGLVNGTSMRAPGGSVPSCRTRSQRMQRPSSPPVTSRRPLRDQLRARLALSRDGPSLAACARLPLAGSHPPPYLTDRTSATWPSRSRATLRVSKSHTVHCPSTRPAASSVPRRLKARVRAWPLLR